MCQPLDYRDYIQSQLGQHGVNQALNIVRMSMGGAVEEDVKDWYYTKDEYRKLTPGQKLALKRRRSQVKGRGGRFAG